MKFFYLYFHFENFSLNFCFSQEINERFQYDEAQYHIIEIRNYPNAKKRFVDTENNECTSEYTQFVISIVMERNGIFYSHLFVTPLIGDDIFSASI